MVHGKAGNGQWQRKSGPGTISAAIDRFRPCRVPYVYRFKKAVMARPFIQRYETAAGGTRYRAWYYDAAGRKVGKVFRTKREAEAFLRTKAAEEATGTLADTAAGRATFEQVWRERESRERFAANTRAVHDTVWKHIGKALGNHPVGEIRSQHVEAALDSIRGPSAKDKARRTIAAKMAARAQLSAEGKRRLNSEQLAALVGEMPERYRALVELMARMGLRPGEAYALTVGQLTDGKLTVDRTTAEETWTKTGEPRTIPVPGVVAEMLRNHIEHFSDPDDPTALVFINQDGRPVEANNFRRVFQRAAAKLGANHGYSPNDLRHTAAAFAVAHGANVYDVQAMLGHAKPSITLDVYGFLWEGSLERLADALDAAIREERK